jgi:hypothetical protein
VVVPTLVNEPFRPTRKPSTVPEVAFCTYRNFSSLVAARSMTPWDLADGGTATPTSLVSASLP